MSDSKMQSQQRFGKFADRYVQSGVHADKSELIRLIETAQPERHWRVLDVATGGGHTALAFAPHVQEVVVSDIAYPMLTAARDHLTASGVTNAQYVMNDAENIPFAENSFDLVVCRLAAHHFPNCFKFVMESTRLLKPGGVFLIQDHVLPEDERAAYYIEAFDTLRDPSHNEAFSESAWRSMCLDAGLAVEHTEIITHRADFLAWAKRQDCSDYTIKRLEILLAQAPQAVREFLKPHAVGTKDASFEHVYIVLSARKPEEN